MEELTIEIIREYHKQYYNPSNTIILFTGNMNTKETLEEMDKVFEQFDYEEPKAYSFLHSNREKQRNHILKTIETKPITDDNQNAIIWNKRIRLNNLIQIDEKQNIFDFHKFFLYTSLADIIFADLEQNLRIRFQSDNVCWRWTTSSYRQSETLIQVEIKNYKKDDFLNENCVDQIIKEEIDKLVSNVGEDVFLTTLENINDYLTEIINVYEEQQFILIFGILVSGIFYTKDKYPILDNILGKLPKTYLETNKFNKTDFVTTLKETLKTKENTSVHFISRDFNKMNKLAMENNELLKNYKPFEKDFPVENFSREDIRNEYPKFDLLKRDEERKIFILNDETSKTCEIIILFDLDEWLLEVDNKKRIKIETFYNGFNITVF